MNVKDDTYKQLNSTFHKRNVEAIDIVYSSNLEIIYHESLHNISTDYGTDVKTKSLKLSKSGILSLINKFNI